MRASVPGTASAIFCAVKDVGANVIMISQASSEHSICFDVPESEVKAVAKALEAIFRHDLDVSRPSQAGLAAARTAVLAFKDVVIPALDFFNAMSSNSLWKIT